MSTIFDFVILGLAVLLALSGFIKGFKKRFGNKLIRIFAFIASFFIMSPISKILEPTQLGVAIFAQFPNIGRYILMAVSYIICVIVIIITLMLFKWIIGNIVGDSEKVGVVDRIFGVVFGLISAFVIVEVLLLGAHLVETYISPFKAAITPFLDAQLQRNTDVFSISKLSYNTAIFIFEYLKSANIKFELFMKF